MVASGSKRPFSLAQYMKPIRVRSNAYGSIHLRRLTLGDLGALDSLGKAQLPARDFVAKVVHRQLLKPSIDLDSVSGWSDLLLERVAFQWGISEIEFQAATASDQDFFELFQTTAISFASKQFGLFKDTLSPTASNLKLQATLQFSSSLYSPISESATIKVAKMYSNIQSLSAIPSTMALTPNYQLFSPATTYSPLPNSLASPLLKEAGDATRKLISSFSAIDEGIYSSISSISPPNYQVGDFFRTLPDLSSTLVRFSNFGRDHQDGEYALDDTGFGFLSFVYVTSAFAEFSKIESRVRGAAITNSLLAETRSEQFAERLRSLFQGSRILSRRWKIVASAIKAHQSREYLLSIPPLLAQCEGVVADALVLKGIVVKFGTKLYLKDANGNLKTDKNNKKIEVKGLGQLVQHSNFHSHPVLQGLVRVTTDHLICDRNEILHGQRTRYGTARLSVIALLVLDMLASEFVKFETGEFVS